MRQGDPKGQDRGLGGPKLIQQGKPNDSSCTSNPRNNRPPSSASQMRGGAHAWPHEAWVTGIAWGTNQTATQAVAAAGSLRSKAARRQQGCQPRRDCLRKGWSGLMTVRLKQHTQQARPETQRIGRSCSHTRVHPASHSKTDQLRSRRSQLVRQLILEGVLQCSSKGLIECACP